jgi:hypothetical protein
LFISPLIHPSVMIRRVVLERVGGATDRTVGTRPLAPADTGRLARRTPEVLLYWRDHPTRLTRTDPHYAAGRISRRSCAIFLGSYRTAPAYRFAVRVRLAGAGRAVSGG